jgi:hypothetical protein
LIRSTRARRGRLAFALTLAGHVSAAFVVLASTACTEELPSSVALSSQGEQIEISYDPLPSNDYADLGDVVGVGVGPSSSEAEQNARNDLRNRAAQLGGTYVHVTDTQQTAYGYFSAKVKVVLRGSAFKAKL